MRSALVNLPVSTLQLKTHLLKIAIFSSRKIIIFSMLKIKKNFFPVAQVLCLLQHTQADLAS